MSKEQEEKARAEEREKAAKLCEEFARMAAGTESASAAAFLAQSIRMGRLVVKQS